MSEKLVEYLATTRLGPRGTMTLPKAYRDALKLETGASMTVLRVGKGLIVAPRQERFEELCDGIALRFERAGIRNSDLQSTLPEVREELARRRYPELFTETETKPRAKAKSSARKTKSGK